MKKLKTSLLVIAGMLLLVLMTTNTFAQELAGKWEGSFVWSGNFAPADDLTYDWDFDKWLNSSRKGVKLTLELEHIRDGKYTGKYIYGPTGADEMRFDATFADSMLKGATEGRIKGSTMWGGYVELALREQDGKRYLEGS
jgi:hypothetical protein